MRKVIFKNRLLRKSFIKNIVEDLIAGFKLVAFESIHICLDKIKNAK